MLRAPRSSSWEHHLFVGDAAGTLDADGASGRTVWLRTAGCCEPSEGTEVAPDRRSDPSGCPFGLALDRASKRPIALPTRINIAAAINPRIRRCSMASPTAA